MKTDVTDDSPFEIIDGDASIGLVLLADHATNRVPARYDRLGLPEGAFERHIAYDIGIEGLTRALAARLGVPAVMSRFSRLLIDPNRGEDDPTLVMRISDGAIVPGNHPISAEEWQHRLLTYHRPYHHAVSETIGRVARTGGRAPLVISLHSFTPYWKGMPRPWHITVLWDSDDRAVHPLLSALGALPGVTTASNEPYDGALRGDTMFRHCMTAGIPHALIEVRQDEIGSTAGIEHWASRLAPILEDLNAIDGLHTYQTFASRTGPY